MALSKKAQKVVELMQAGAYWRTQLETQYRFGEKFVTRLRDAKGHVISGFGPKTFYEMEGANLLTHRECASSSTWPTEYNLRNAA